MKIDNIVEKCETDLNFPNLQENIIKIKKIKDPYCKYILRLYREYYNLIKDHNNRIDIYEELSSLNTNNSQKYQDKVIISSSHDRTYHLLKALNVNHTKKILVVCFDMHCDAYDYHDNLWKGNPFSKLIHENIISHLLVIGISKNKRKNTEDEINTDIINHVNILRRGEDIKEYITADYDNLIISIDIDCFNTRRKKYTATEYSPYTILKKFSEKQLRNKEKDKVLEYARNSIFVRNELGYANLYHVGENYLTLSKLNKYIIQIKKICDSKRIDIGILKDDYCIIGDITEVYGYDCHQKTMKLISEVINILSRG